MRARALIRPAVCTLLAALAAATAHAGPSPGIEVGFNQSKTTLEATEFGLPDPDYDAAWSAGVTLDVPLGGRLSLATGLRYLEYGERASVEIITIDGGARFERHLVWRRLALPVLLRVRPFPLAGVFLAAGPEAGYLVTAWHEDAVVGVPPVGPEKSRAALARPAGDIYEGLGTFFADPNDVYSRWNLALAGGAGWEFPLAGGTGRVEGRYTHGLLDISARDGFERRTRAFELLLGLRW